VRTRIALLALALAALALAPAAASAQANAPGAPGAPMPPIARLPAMGHVRDGWYIGFGVGSGVGGLTVDGSSQSFTDLLSGNGVDSSVSVALQFEVGATLAPDLLLGFDVRALRSQGSSSFGGDIGVQATDYLAMLTWFPAREGFFLRTGAGLAMIQLDQRVNGATANDTHGGVAILGGLGYAFWLGQRFNLTLNLDASAQYYGGGAGLPESSRFVDAYVGFVWY